MYKVIFDKNIPKNIKGMIKNYIKQKCNYDYIERKFLNIDIKTDIKIIGNYISEDTKMLNNSYLMLIYINEF